MPASGRPEPALEPAGRPGLLPGLLVAGVVARSTMRMPPPTARGGALEVVELPELEEPGREAGTLGLGVTPGSRGPAEDPVV